MLSLLATKAVELLTQVGITPVIAANSPPEVDWPRRAKGRLFCTHLHDNDGKTMGPIPNTRCDTHFLPFDGVRDWEDAMLSLAESGYRGPLTLEVKKGRDVCRQLPIYAEWGEARFMKEAYARADRLRTIFEEACRRLDS